MTFENFVLATLQEMAPKDAQERLISVQMVCGHQVAMQCLENAATLGQSIDTKERYINMAMKLMRTFPVQMEAVNRHRGKIPNPLFVGNVNVNDGGTSHRRIGEPSGAGKGFR